MTVCTFFVPKLNKLPGKTEGGFLVYLVLLPRLSNSFLISACSLPVWPFTEVFSSALRIR